MKRKAINAILAFAILVVGAYLAGMVIKAACYAFLLALAI